MKGVCFDIKRYAIHEGPGIRTAVFLKGCPLSCVWCHNPQGISRKQEIRVFPARCRSCETCKAVCESRGEETACQLCGVCVDHCAYGARTMVGRLFSERELLERIVEDKPFYDQSHGGVTFTGGEPLLQWEFLKSCLQLCSENRIHTAVDTCGYAANEQTLEILKNADLVLYDLKLMEDDLHRHYTGVSMKKIVENLKWLDQHHRQIWIRVPIIPGITDTDENLDAIGRLVSSLQNTRRVHLLPYHRLGSKQSARGDIREQWLPPTAAELERARNKLEHHGLRVHLGG